MIVKRVVRGEDGNMEATLMLSPEQAAFLLNFALGLLVQKGVVTVMDQTPEEFEAEQPTAQADGGGGVVTPEPAQTTVTEAKKLPIDLLANIDIKDMAKA